MIRKTLLKLIACGAIISAVLGSTTLAKAENINTKHAVNKILLSNVVQNDGNQAVVVNTTGAPLVLYSNDNTSSKISSYISVGEMLTIQNSTNGFYKVKVHETGAIGYIAKSNLQKIESGVNASYTSINKKGMIINVSSAVHLRQNATMNSAILNNLGNKTNINILGKQGQWYKVSYNGTVGYIYETYVATLNQNISGIVNSNKTTTSSNSVKGATSNITSNSKVVVPTKPTVNKTESHKTTPAKNTVNKAETNSGNKSTATSSSVKGSNNEIIPNGNIIYSAKSYAVPANEVAQMINGTYKGGGKQIFLTFDDGPSAVNTPKVLNILKKYGVHATFFVLGSNLQTKTEQNLLKEEIMDGNAIGDHSYSHDYSKLYPGNKVNVTAFMNELNKTNSIMRSILGPNFNARVIRMPGGYMSRAYYHDKNLPALNSEFRKEGITSIDWNAETGDATGKAYTPSQLVNNAIKETKGYHHIVLLMHDIKGNTVQALPELIQYYKSQGYSFDVISNS